MNDEIVALHQEMFGFVPPKAGVAYERLAAVVLAVLGWEEVTHDVSERAVGRLASHQLDVTALSPTGTPGRLIVECKDYATTVGEEILNTLVGVLKQIGGATAAVITTKGFTAGARAIAVDEDIALVLLRHFDPKAEKGKFVMKVVVTMRAMLPSFSNFDVVIGPSAHDLEEHLDIALTGADRLRRLDGTPAEKLIDLLSIGEGDLAEGSHSRRVDFPDERLIESTSGVTVPISALTWTEDVVGAPFTFETEAKGTPVLVLEQLDGEGSVFSGRLVVSDDLHAWEIDGDGIVHARGHLPQTAAAQV
jgi:hypothetical protein